MGLIILLVIWKLNARPSDDHKSNDEKKVKSGFQTLREIISIPFLILIWGGILTGLAYGTQNTFLYLYLQNDLNAPSKLISYMSTITYASQAIFLLVADKVINKIGCMNSIAINIFLESTKMFTYAYVKQSPPYFALGLHVVNFALWGFSWIAMLKYGFQITPPHLVGSTTAIITVLSFTLCKFSRFFHDLFMINKKSTTHRW